MIDFLSNSPQISTVQYDSDLRLKIAFSDNTVQLIDFEPFLNYKPHTVFAHYRKPENFKKFRVENGQLVWGKNWDLIFPVSQLHKGTVEFGATEPDFQKLRTADLFINSAAIDTDNDQSFSEFLAERRKQENAKSKAATTKVAAK